MEKERRKNKKYSAALKRMAVEEYLNNRGSQEKISKKYGILGHHTLKDWVLWYNSHGTFKERSYAKGEIYMTKGRKTTPKERAEIVEFCIRNNKDYGLTVETYGVSYQQIYQWVKKYEAGGVERLQDNRGRTKPESELTEIERLKLEIKILEVKNRQLEIENAFIKKLEELKGGGC